MDAPRSGKAAAALLALALVLASCASVPYQEMSDARQAIDSARPVVSDEVGPRELVERAQALLNEAEAHLRAHEYDAARATAERAKALAIEAREKAEKADQ